MDVASTQEINLPNFQCHEIKDALQHLQKSEICYDAILNCRYTLNLDSGKYHTYDEGGAHLKISF